MDKFAAFIIALRALCREHGVMLDAGYDGLDVWDAGPNEDQDWIEWIRDCTTHYVAIPQKESMR